MNVRTLMALTLVLGLLFPTVTASATVANFPEMSATTPNLTGPCVAGAVYDPACDVDHDGDVDVFDIQTTAGHWNQSGVWLSDNNHNHLGQTWTGSNNPLKIQGAFGAPDYAPLVLSNSNSTGVGLRITSSGLEGIYVDSAGTAGLAVAGAVDGVYIRRAGNPSTFTASPSSNGFEVAGAQGDGLHVGRADGAGVHVNAAGQDGIHVGTAGSPTTTLANPVPDGFEITGAQGNGLYVGRADNDGVAVNNAGEDGFYVGAAGSPSTVAPSADSNGFEVAGAQDNGLFVGRADWNGVYVNSAGLAGVFIGGNAPTGVAVGGVTNDAFTASGPGANGFSVASSGDDGLYVLAAGDDGVQVWSALSDGVNADGDSYAGYFWGDIYVAGNCIGCLQANFAVNAGERALEPGDVVSIQAVTLTDLDTGPALWQALLAQPGQAVAGVVAGRAELDVQDEHRPNETGRRLVPRAGAAQPGEYLTVVYSGPMQVKATGAISAGERLTIDEAGNVRGLRRTEVNGVPLREDAPVLGVALSAAENSLVWVLVNPQ